MTCSMILFYFCPFFVRTSLLQRKGLRDVILKISNKNNKLLHNYKQLIHLQFGKDNTVEVIIPKFKYFFWWIYVSYGVGICGLARLYFYPEKGGSV